MKTGLPNLLGAAIRDYFTDHLPQLRGTSPHTIHSYRDSMVLLLRFTFGTSATNSNVPPRHDSPDPIPRTKSPHPHRAPSARMISPRTLAETDARLRRG